MLIRYFSLHDHECIRVVFDAALTRKWPRSILDASLRRQRNQHQGAAMKPFALESNMLTMRGVFYPTGHLFIMFPTEQHAREAERLLLHDGIRGDEISLLTPKEIHEKIAATVDTESGHMPSPGTEAATVRHFEQLAQQGHHALLVHAPSARETDRVMRLLASAKISYAQRYRHLIIEDLVDE